VCGLKKAEVSEQFKLLHNECVIHTGHGFDVGNVECVQKFGHKTSWETSNWKIEREMEW